VDRRPSNAKLWIGGLVRVAFVPVVLLWPAGDWTWPHGWAMTGVLVGYAVVMTVWLTRNDPDLLMERLQASPVQEGQKGWDRVLMVAMLVVGLALYVVPPLDHRGGWSEVPTWASAVGLGACAVGFGGIFFVMRANTFLSRVVKIQEGRGHTVITDGPYRFVRHPMYAWVLLILIAFPIALDSWWGLIPAVGMAALIVIRTVLEDRTLHAELEGYPEYAQRTKHRLVPGIF